MDLRDLWRGPLTYRRLSVLVKHLPMESATKTELRNAAPESELKASANAPYGAWSQTDMILAELVDVARWLQWSKTKNAENNTGQPEPFPRPGVKRAAASVQDMEKVTSLLDWVRAHNGAAPTGYIEG